MSGTGAAIPPPPPEGFDDPAEAAAYRREVEALGQQRLFEPARELEPMTEVRRQTFGLPRTHPAGCTCLDCGSLSRDAVGRSGDPR